MANPALGPRVLLRRLREVMAEPETAQTRLDRTVSLIAANMVAEVCSLYVMRPGGVLELYATEGLNREAVKVSRLRIGEGLVGTIAATAQPLNLSDAQAHRSFKYLPETGEEIYHSFLGVPILRGGLTIGVMVVQNRTARHYSEEEEEALQTTAMVLAEIVSSGELDEVAEAVDVDVAHLRSHHLSGLVLAEGIALGHAVLHEPRITIVNFITENVGAEKERLEAAITEMRNHVDSLVDRSDFAREKEYGEVLEAFRMFAYDRGWVQRIREAVDTGLTAEAAVERVQNDTRARMLRASDPFLRDRLHDLDDLAYRLLRILTGAAATAAHGQLPRDAIIVARNMGPAELLDYDRGALRGLVVEGAAPNSHVAIVARALGVPALGQVDGLIDLVDTGDAIIIDGGSGEIHVRPSADIETAYAEKVRFYAHRQARYAELREQPAITRDGTRMSLSINAGLVVDLPHLAESGADGIGLFRTELQFMMARSFPRLARQAAHYGAVLDAAGEKPVVFRSLDIGSDKVLPYLHRPREENPAMGWRAMRMALDRQGLLRLQVRALLTAARGRELKLMFPMIAEVDEFLQGREVVEKERQRLQRLGHELPSAVKLGAMIEVPSIVWQLDRLLEVADFISIGSNDLLQFLFACDRGHPLLADRFDPLSPVALKVLRHMVERGEAHDTAITLCGEMAGRPLEAMALAGIGYRSISMAPAAIGPVKSMILALDRAKLWAMLEPLLEDSRHSLRPQLLAFAREHDVPV
ncbi:MAG TPA: phosphoenolpyruvate--protein phosphotransferase [Aestuariivirgaceae bacterium]|nr:phosphoenolpyruvate--protein phosphotransferase [Aestuariivirgaceae bacterium]